MAIAPGAACAEPGFVPSAQATVAVEPEPGSASAAIPAAASSPQPNTTERAAVSASASAVQHQRPATTSQSCEPAATTPARPGKTYVTRGSYVVPPADDTVPSPAPGGTTYHAVKRAFDLCFSAVATAVLLIPSAIICAAIVVDSPGASPIFTQKRVGQNGKPLYMYKSGDRQALEVFYARHASLPLDLRIFARTFKAMAKGR